MMVNLDVITCMQKFEDPIQVAFELDLIIKKGFEFEYELELELGLHSNNWGVTAIAFLFFPFCGNGCRHPG
jgi:hypothetical protein